MKKFAFALAAGVLAAGVSAQAAEVSSAEYAVITIPVTAGNNLIGISVAADAATLTSVIGGIDSSAEVKKYVGGSYTEDGQMAGSFPVSTGDAVWYNDVQTGTTVYECGVVSSASPAVTVNCEFTAMSSPLSDSIPLSSVTISTDGSSVKANAEKIHIWNGNGYNTYWRKVKNGTATWKCFTAGAPATTNICPGQGFFVEVPSATAQNTATITFGAAQ